MTNEEIMKIVKDKFKKSLEEMEVELEEVDKKVKEAESKRVIDKGW